MEDTTTSPSAPGPSTDESAATPLDDKEPGQAAVDTDASQDGSDAQAGASDDGSDNAEDSEHSNESAEEGADEVGELLTPEQVKNLPPELKAQYASMKSALDKKMGRLNELISKAQERPAPTMQPDGDQPSEARAAVESALKRHGVDPKSLSDENLQSLELVAEVSLEAGQRSAQKVVSPLTMKEAQSEVDGYFKEHPDRSKYRKSMGELDAKTGGRLDLDTIYFAVAGKDLAAAAEGRRVKKLRDAAGGNAETGAGGSGAQGEGDIFDEIAHAGGRGTSPLL